MIKRIELNNFENHEHSILDFCNGFNLVCGPSNSGKTSIIRAISTLCYNDFNLKSVRVGNKYCEISITTEKGSVTARRGKNINEWDITPINGKTTNYKSIGKGILEETQKILNINIIKLGDIEMKINIMEQLESHFLISSLNGKDASGSLRAQIIDEISGLAGIETVIKEVSSDHLKHKKENNVLEDKNKSLLEKLYDENELKKEEDNLQKAKDLLQNYSKITLNLYSLKEIDKNLNNLNLSLEALNESYNKFPNDNDINLACNNITELDNKTIKLKELSHFLQNGKDLSNSRKILNDELKKLIDTSDLATNIEDCSLKLKEINLLKDLNNNLTKVLKDILEKEDSLKLLPNAEEAVNYLVKSEEKYLKYNVVNTIYQQILKILSVLKPQQKELKSLIDTNILTDTISNLETKIDKLEELHKLNESFNKLNNGIKFDTNNTNKLDANLKQLENENYEILSQYKTCPVCDSKIETETIK